MTAPLLTIRVEGIPRPQGSLDPYGTVNGKVRFAHPELLLAWRKAIIDTAKAGLPEDWTPLTGGVVVRLSFGFTRPQRHYTSNGRLRPDAPYYMSNGTDLDKLTRAVNDALTIAGVWDDDRRVSICRDEKHYADAPGVTIEIWTLQE